METTERDVEDPVESLLVRWEELRASGREPDIEELTDDPAVRDRLIPEIKKIRRMEQGLGRGASADEPEASGIPNRFESPRLHAGGGMGLVYRAWDRELDREVAYKVIKAGLARDPAAVERFLREARLTARLQHPGIVPIYGLVAEGDGRPAYAMKFVEGQTLDRIAADSLESRLDSNGNRAAWQPILRHVIRLCRAVQHAHDRGILHRDLSPRNVIAAEEDETIVIDWGLAIEADSPEAVEGAQEWATRAGTAPYSAPEIWEASRQRPHSRQTDLYAIGAVLHHLLTGRPPFEGGTGAVIEAIRQGPPPEARDRESRVPRPLSKIAARAMARNPGDRYESVSRIADDLEAWIAGDRVSADREPWIDSAWRWSTRHRGRVVTAAAVVALALLGLTSANVIMAARAELRRQQEFVLASKVNSGLSTVRYLMSESELAIQREIDPNAVDQLTRAIESGIVDKAQVAEMFRNMVVMLNQQRAWEGQNLNDALMAIEDAISAQEELQQLRPDLPEHRFDLGSLHVKRGALLLNTPEIQEFIEGLFQGLARPEDARRLVEPSKLARISGIADEAIGWFEKAGEQYATIPPGVGFEDEFRTAERHLQHSLGITFLISGRYTEALIALDSRAALTTEEDDLLNETGRDFIRFAAEEEQSKLPWSRPPHVDHPRAIAMADALADRPGTSHRAIYNAACVHALASTDAEASSEERENRAIRAVALLGRCEQLGLFTELPEHVPMLQSTDDDLAPLRARDDFRELTDRVVATAP